MSPASPLRSHRSGCIHWYRPWDNQTPMFWYLPARNHYPSRRSRPVAPRPAVLHPGPYISEEYSL